MVKPGAQESACTSALGASLYTFAHGQHILLDELTLPARPLVRDSRQDKSQLPLRLPKASTASLFLVLR